MKKIFDPVIRVVVRYRKHPSILAINKKCDSKSRFHFQFIDRKDILKEIQNLSKPKGTQESDIPTKLIKDNSCILANFILFSFNTCIVNWECPLSMKLANITPVFEKDSKNLKGNYQPC